VAPVFVKSPTELKKPKRRREILSAALFFQKAVFRFGSHAGK
jgi:hypothetical protein